MRKAKEMTIDDLAGMMQREFLGIHKKMDDGFARIDQHFNDLESRMSNLELRMKEVEGRMDSLEEINEEIIERLGRIEHLVDEDQQARIKRLEDSMRGVYERLALKKA